MPTILAFPIDPPEFLRFFQNSWIFEHVPEFHIVFSKFLEFSIISQRHLESFDIFHSF